MPLRYTVQQGDSIVNVAFQHGFHADTLWNHRDNAELRRLRSDMNIVAPGDFRLSCAAHAVEVRTAQRAWSVRAVRRRSRSRRRGRS